VLIGGAHPTSVSSSKSRWGLATNVLRSGHDMFQKQKTITFMTPPLIKDYEVRLIVGLIDAAARARGVDVVHETVVRGRVVGARRRPPLSRTPLPHEFAQCPQVPRWSRHQKVSLFYKMENFKLQNRDFSAD